MSYRIEVSPPAREEIKSLPAHVRAQAMRQIQALGQDPRSRGASELRNKPGVFRCWLAGRWRIAYLIDDDQQLIRILRVRRKEQIDYESLEPPEKQEQ